MNSRKSPIRSLAPLLCTLVFAGCAAIDTRIDGHQYRAVDDPGGEKNIALVLRSYRGCAPGDEVCEKNLPRVQELQELLETCLHRGLNRISPRVNLIKHAEWGNHGNLADLMLPLAAGEGVDLSRLQPADNGAKLDYLISMGVTKGNSMRKTKLEVAGASAGAAEGPFVIPPVVLWGVGQQWTNTAFIETRVYTADTGVLAGELSAKLTKDAFWILPVITVIPLVPIGSSPNVERKSCVAMGEALGRFFEGAGNDYLE